MPSRSKTSSKTVEDEDTLSKLIRGDKRALAERAAKGGNLPAGSHPDEKALAKKYGLTVEQIRELNQAFKKGEKKAKADGEGEEHKGKAEAPWYTRGGSSFYGLLFGRGGGNQDILYGQYGGGSGQEAGGSPLEQAIEEARKAASKKAGSSKPSSSPASAPSGGSSAPSGGPSK